MDKEEDNDVSMVRALSMLLSKYQSERRFEEAAIVSKLIEAEKAIDGAKGEAEKGYHVDM